MQVAEKRAQRPWMVVGAVLLVTSGVSAAMDSWVSIGPDGKVALEEVARETAPLLTVNRSDDSRLDVSLALGGFALRTSRTKGGRFVEVHWPDAGMAGQIGQPALPVVRRLLVAPRGATVTVTPHVGEPVFVDLDAVGFVSFVKPAQAPVPKLPGAIEAAPFDFDEQAYGIDADWPAERVTVEELGIVRGQRLFLLELRPIAYHPVAGRLTFWPEMSATVHFQGAARPANERSVLPGLGNVVINPELLPPATRGAGNYLIVAASAYESAIASFALAKQAQGFNVFTWVDTSASNTVIKAHIESLWGTADEPEYVLLVGDTDTIPEWTGGGEGTPDTDLPYSCMDGSSDWYPDLALGRFPVRSTGQLDAIVTKTLYYEDEPLADPDYLNRAVFMASEDNYTVSEGTHNWVISNHMDPNGITSDKLYCHTYSATTQQVRNAFNGGRFFGIYSGHGATTYWADGPVFYQSDVNNLTNADMYAFVCSFACVSGSYTLNECFTETWIRAANKGALSIYGSSVNSYWTQDDVFERRLFDAIYDTGDAVLSEVGPVWNEARVRYLAQMGADSTTRRYFEMYNLLGDPSLPFPNAAPDLLSITYPEGLPDALAPGETTDISVRIGEGEENYVSGSGTLYYRYDGGVFETSSLTHVSGDLYQATLPAAYCEDTPEFYFSAEGDQSGVVYDPPTAPASTYTVVVGEVVTIFADDFETDKGWTVYAGADIGNWERADPQEVDNGGTFTQPEDDHTSEGTLCYVTGPLAGSSAGSYDVDGGPTRLTSPTLELAGTDATVSYWRWYHISTQWDDELVVELSTNGGSSWVTVETVDDSETWTYVEWKVSDYLTPTDEVQVRFVVADSPNNSLVESLIDDFEVFAFQCIPVGNGDFDEDQDVDLADFARFQECFEQFPLPGTCGPGDMNGSGRVDATDYALFVDALEGAR